METLNIVKKIDEGSFSKVYLVRKRNMFFACKIINYKRAEVHFINKFAERELNVLRSLKHKHIIHIESINKADQKCFIIMRYAERGNLFDHIYKYGALTEDQGKVWGKQLTLAVKYLHGLDIAHRDLKCENILITANYNIKLTDFGFSRWCVENSSYVLSSTYCGTLLYAAPEVIKRTPYFPKCADMWSLGIILYIMLNMAMPFDEPNVHFLYHLQVNQLWEFNPSIRNKLSKEYKMLILNLLQPDFRKRWHVDDVHLSKWLRADSTTSMTNHFILEEHVSRIFHFGNWWNKAGSSKETGTSEDCESKTSLDLTYLMKPN